MQAKSGYSSPLESPFPNCSHCPLPPAAPFHCRGIPGPSKAQSTHTSPLTKAKSTLDLTKMPFKQSAISVSRLDNIQHFLRRDHKGFYGKMLYVASHQISILTFLPFLHARPHKTQHPLGLAKCHLPNQHQQRSLCQSYHQSIHLPDGNQI